VIKTKYIYIFIISCCIIICEYLIADYFSSRSLRTPELTTIEIQKDSIFIGKVSYHSKENVSFQLKNTGKQPFTIQAVNSSCGCISAKYDKQPIAIGDIATVILEFKPNSHGYFSKTVDVMCNVPEGFVKLKICGEVQAE